MKYILLFVVFTNILLSQTKTDLNKGKGFNQIYLEDTFSTKLKKANYESLLIFTNSSNPYEKCLAFYHILKFTEANIYEILLKNISDTTKLTIKVGCFIKNTNVFDYLMQFSDEENYPENIVRLSPFQKKQLDSIILYKDPTGYKSKSLNNVLQSLKPELKYYERIKYLAYEKNKYYAYKLLLKYNNPENVMSLNQFLERKGAMKIGKGENSIFIIDE